MSKSIMVLGTTSNAGKSLITAALCRIFKEDGYKVAPFKAQNMALNSFITKDGLEMGRAQVMQAEAAGVEPDVRMNPILLKPTTDRKSQVIVRGKVWKDLSATEYYKQKAEILPLVIEDFKSLSEENDIVVLEGAGSPSEINLKSVDIVNLGLAKLIDTPAIVVGDIDRGGVFASLAGTVALLDEEEKPLVKGVLINKFRGDEEILKPGLKMLEDIIKIPVLGVVHYLDVDIDDEDSLSDRLKSKGGDALVDIAVIRLPHISNFTDFNVFSLIEGVSLRYVTKARDLGNPDMIIIPGTKNTMDDLKWLRETGLEGKIKFQSEKGKAIFGICGGYQMLGKVLKDPYEVETGGEVEGLGLLNTETVFEQEKTTTQIQGIVNNIEGFYKDLSGLEVKGYEIHMGKSTITEGSFMNLLQGKEDGCVYNNVAGTYLHGFFDNGEVAKTIVSILLKEKGISEEEVLNFNLEEYKELQYKKLAEEVRKALDIDKIYEIMGMK